MENRKRKVGSIDKMFKELNAKRKKHPIYYFFFDIYWRIYRFVDRIPLNVKTFIQRGKRGWAVSDVWGLHYYLATVISKSMRNLKNQMHSYPPHLTEGKWIDIINKIIYTFEVAERISNSELYLIKDKKQRVKWQKILDGINKKYNNRDRCMTNKEIREYEEGWKLFKEYFYNLWD